MFEKEAKEYAVLNARQYMHNEGIGFCTSEEEVRQAYQKGAEFGYNKANEWHYVKDGDLPKIYQKCCFIYSNIYGEGNKVIFSESSVNVITGVFAFLLDEETSEETTEPCFYDDINDVEICLKEVYAWKEIVFPKEIKK